MTSYDVGKAMFIVIHAPAGAFNLGDIYSIAAIKLYVDRIANAHEWNVIKITSSESVYPQGLVNLTAKYRRSSVLLGIGGIYDPNRLFFDHNVHKGNQDMPDTSYSVLRLVWNDLVRPYLVNKSTKYKHLEKTKLDFMLEYMDKIAVCGVDSYVHGQVSTLSSVKETCDSIRLLSGLAATAYAEGKPWAIYYDLAVGMASTCLIQVMSLAEMASLMAVPDFDQPVCIQDEDETTSQWTATIPMSAYITTGVNHKREPLRAKAS